MFDAVEGLTARQRDKLLVERQTSVALSHWLSSRLSARSYAAVVDPWQTLSAMDGATRREDLAYADREYINKWLERALVPLRAQDVADLIGADTAEGTHTISPAAPTTNSTGALIDAIRGATTTFISWEAAKRADAMTDDVADRLVGVGQDGRLLRN